MSDILLVAVPSPLRRLFEYLPPVADPARTIQPGTRVLVPFGGQSLVGVVISTTSQSGFPRHKLKPVTEVLDSDPVIPEDLLWLCAWSANYYQHPPGEVLHTALPLGLRKPQTSDRCKRVWTLTTEGKGLPDTALRRSPKQQLIHQVLLRQSTVDDADLARLEVAPSVLKAMVKKGLLAEEQRRFAANHDRHTPPSAPLLLAEEPLPLTEEQQLALDAVRYHEYGCYLLEGITGSGKTEVYLHAIARVLQAGRQALVLVPEIGLAPQTLRRFRRRFQVPVVALHSNVSDKARTDHWHQARTGEARVVIGTRLAIFTPMPELGLIIIDEEHDLSFKQQEGLRYSARDLAVVRAHRRQIPLLLGSATPSLESLHNALQGRYRHLRLQQRTGGAQLPDFQLVDIRQQPLDAGLSTLAIDEIGRTLESGEQVLVFINRRGFAPAWICADCGWSADCGACDARMTLHYAPRHLRCHHCNHQRPVTSRCPTCQSARLTAVGQGTERTEAALAERFPAAQIIRVDQDSMQRKNAMAELSEHLRGGAPCIVVGTQMLAKGHHFPRMTLAVLVDIDQGLYSGDFRGLERLGQQIVQVAGRAGRGDRRGRVLLQTSKPDHPLLQRVITDGYHPFARQLLQDRQANGIPPFSHMVLLRAESKRAENACEFLELALTEAMRLRAPSPVHRYLGPMPALMERRQDRFRFQLQINFENRPDLQQLLKALLELLESHALAKRTRWSVDVDPQDMS